MIETMWVQTVCPLCGFANELNLESGTRVIGCDPDEGGCDEYFAVRVQFVADVTTYKLVASTPPDVEPTAPLCPVHQKPMMRGKLRPDLWYCPCETDHGYCDEAVNYE